MSPKQCQWIGSLDSCTELGTRQEVDSPNRSSLVAHWAGASRMHKDPANGLLLHELSELADVGWVDSLAVPLGLNNHPTTIASRPVEAAIDATVAAVCSIAQHEVAAALEQTEDQFLYDIRMDLA